LTLLQALFNDIIVTMKEESLHVNISIKPAEQVPNPLADRAIISNSKK